MKIKQKQISIDKIVAQIISWILNPFFVLPITIIASHLQQIDANPMPFIFFIFVGGFPIFFFYLYSEYIHKEKPWEFFINLPRERRNTPLLVAIYSFLFNTVLFGIFNEPLWQEISILLVIYAGSMYLANRYIDKASWHAGVLAFCVFYLADKISMAFAFGLILLPVIFWARVLLHKHTWIQLYLGTVIGLVIGILSWTIH